MKTILGLAIAVIVAGIVSFFVTSVLVGGSASAQTAPDGDTAASHAPAAAASPADGHGAPAATVQAVTAQAAATPASGNAPTAAHPTAAPTGGHPPARPTGGMTLWKPEAERLTRPTLAADVPAYLVKTSLVQLGIVEGLIERDIQVTWQPESGTVAVEVRTRTDPRGRQREYAQVLAQGLVSSVQALELPSIKAVSIGVTDPSGRPALVGQVGQEAARQRPPATWEQSAAGTRAFFEWVTASRGGSRPEDRIGLEGAWIR
ncbi:MAG: hypothetical protein U0556_06855 [Dehalococcoidia bacterium]